MKKNLIIIGLAAALALTGWHLCVTKVRLTEAKAMVQTITLLQQATVASTNIQTAVENLDYVAFHYSAKSYRGKDALDLLCASYTSNAVAEMIGHLKILTGRDLGDSPEAWIDAYSGSRKIDTKDPTHSGIPDRADLAGVARGAR